MERDYQKKIIDDIDSFGPDHITAFKIIKANIDSVPDLYMVSKAGSFLIELKRPGEIPKKGQAYMLKLLGSYGDHTRTYSISSWQEWVTLRTIVILPGVKKEFL